MDTLTLSRFFRIRRASDEWLELVKEQGQEHYPVDGPQFGSFERTFEPFLQGRTFNDLIIQRHKEGKPTHILELMGSAYFVNCYPQIDSITGVRLLNVDSSLRMKKHRGRDGLLTTPHTEDIDKAVAFPRREIIPGNILNRDTWEDLYASMDKRDIPSYDLIMIRPLGGWLSIFGISADATMIQDLIILSIFLQRTYSLLSCNSGTLYIDLPTCYSTNYQKYVDCLSKDPALEITLNKNKGILRIIKHPGAPTSIFQET